MMMSSSSSPSNTFAGRTNHATKLVDLTQFGNAGIITGFKIFWSNAIVGLELAFNGKSAGAVKGTHNGAVFEEAFNVNQGDYITQVFGRADQFIECFGVRTARGVNKIWGNPLSGTPFTFALHGHYVKSLKLGVSDHLDYIEPVFENEMFVNCNRLNFSNHGKFTESLGKRRNDTEEFNDFDWVSNKFNYQVAEVKVWHDGRFVHGIQFSYLLDGTKKSPGQHSSGADGIRMEKLELAEGENITKVLIRAGDIIDHITLVTNTGRTLSAGGQGGVPHLAVAPEGHHFVAVNGGIGGHLHFVQFHFDEIY